MFLSDFDHVVVNGFFPSLTLKSILNNITEEIMEHQGSFPSVQEQVNFIQVKKAIVFMTQSSEGERYFVELVTYDITDENI